MNKRKNRQNWFSLLRSTGLSLLSSRILLLLSRRPQRCSCPWWGLPLLSFLLLRIDWPPPPPLQWALNSPTFSIFAKIALCTKSDVVILSWLFRILSQMVKSRSAATHPPASTSAFAPPPSLAIESAVGLRPNRSPFSPFLRMPLRLFLLFILQRQRQQAIRRAAPPAAAPAAAAVSRPEPKRGKLSPCESGGEGFINQRSNKKRCKK